VGAPPGCNQQLEMNAQQDVEHVQEANKYSVGAPHVAPLGGNRQQESDKLADDAPLGGNWKQESDKLADDAPQDGEQTQEAGKYFVDALHAALLDGNPQLETHKLADDAPQDVAQLSSSLW